MTHWTEVESSTVIIGANVAEKNILDHNMARGFMYFCSFVYLFNGEGFCVGHARIAHFLGQSNLTFLKV
jgi:hypothetical protein